MKAFRLARMSAGIAVLTYSLLLLPLAFVFAANAGVPALRLPAIFLVAIYGWIWLWFRPTRFEVSAASLDIVWPLRRVSIPRADVTLVRVLDGATLKREIGWGLRVGAGGMWGGFGWLYTKHRGKVRFYISRTDRFAWIERRSGVPWLLTPDDLDAFAHALAVSSRGSAKD